MRFVNYVLIIVQLKGEFCLYMCLYKGNGKNVKLKTRQERGHFAPLQVGYIDLSMKYLNQGLYVVGISYLLKYTSMSTDGLN